MQLNPNFNKLFNNTPILGMIHLAGDSLRDKVDRALEEIGIYQDELVDGVIIENYHGTYEDVQHTLEVLNDVETAFRPNKWDILIGVNILPNEFQHSISLAAKYKADFVQLDHIAGNYTRGILDFNHYSRVREAYPSVIVLGGVWPKYYTPIPFSNLESDLKEGMRRAEAIVVTGTGTGKETPIDKIKQFRNIIKDHPLIIGAGLTPENAYNQLIIADGAIVGSTFKKNHNTEGFIDKKKVHDFMDVVEEVRRYKNSLSK